MEDANTWNKAYATALREFAASTESKLEKNPALTVTEVIAGLRMYADAINPEGE